jgi:hypothetical protein
MFNLFSTFNTAVVNQGNLQFGQNVAVFSPFATQTLLQGASNNATVIQLG